MLVLGASVVREILDGHEIDIVDCVASAYRAHAAGDSSLPHSVFLRFPAGPGRRIIALPAYLGDGFEVAGVKWVSSFPDNIEHGLERAAAVVVLNSPESGRPIAIIEGSYISASRTAASAALAAGLLLGGSAAPRMGVIGCGPISFEVVRFMRATRRELADLVVHDIRHARAQHFAGLCRTHFPELSIEIVDSVSPALACSLVCIATSAGTPHVNDLAPCPAGAVILHISLRDITPQIILRCDNLTDDVDHVCRAETSLHLAEQLVGNRDFIRGSIGDVLRGVLPARPDPDRVVVFSPFGLGILDLAVASMVRRHAIARGMGLSIADFLPSSWAREDRPVGVIDE